MSACHCECFTVHIHPMLAQIVPPGVADLGGDGFEGGVAARRQRCGPRRRVVCHDGDIDGVVAGQVALQGGQDGEASAHVSSGVPQSAVGMSHPVQHCARASDSGSCMDWRGRSARICAAPSECRRLRLRSPGGRTDTCSHHKSSWYCCPHMLDGMLARRTATTCTFNTAKRDIRTPNAMLVVWRIDEITDDIMNDGVYCVILGVRRRRQEGCPGRIRSVGAIALVDGGDRAPEQARVLDVPHLRKCAEHRSLAISMHTPVLSAPSRGTGCRNESDQACWPPSLPANTGPTGASATSPSAVVLAGARQCRQLFAAFSSMQLHPAA